MNTLRIPGVLVLLLVALLLTACQEDSATTTTTENTPVAASNPAGSEPLAADYRAPELADLQTADQLGVTCAAEIARLNADIERLEAFGGNPMWKLTWKP